MADPFALYPIARFWLTVYWWVDTWAWWDVWYREEAVFDSL